MFSSDGEYQICDTEDCEEKIKNHAWGRIKAKGWFFSKEGEVRCPTHVPEWYEKWRKVRR